MNDQENTALHRDHRARIQQLESNLVVLAKNTEKIIDVHEKLLAEHARVLRQLATVTQQVQGQVQGLGQMNSSMGGRSMGRFAETFTPRVNTRPGATRSAQIPFLPTVQQDPLDVEPEDAEMVDD